MSGRLRRYEDFDEGEICREIASSTRNSTPPLMRVPTTITIFGYPGLAMLLFLTAAAGGFWMAWTILAGDVRRTRTR